MLGDRLESLIGRLSGVLEATHARTRLVLARHPAKPSWDAFWIVQGRVADWGKLPAEAELAERTRKALTHRPAAAVPKDEVDEVRIVQSWAASHEPPQFELTDTESAGRVAAWAREVAAAAA